MKYYFANNRRRFIFRKFTIFSNLSTAKNIIPQITDDGFFTNSLFAKIKATILLNERVSLKLRLT